MEVAGAETITTGHRPYTPPLEQVSGLYMCMDSRVAMHELCAACPDSLDFFMHPNHTLALQCSHNPFARHSYEACGDPIHVYFFRCKPCSFELHPFYSLRHAIIDGLMK